MESKHIECACYSNEHTVKFSYLPGEGEVYLSTQLCPLFWYKRLWLGARYILGLPNKRGHYEETMLSYKGVDQLKDFIKEFEKDL